MEITLVSGATTFEAGVNTIKKIDNADMEAENLVVVPDSFSLQAESLIFDTLNINSTFNIEVVGISRLASKILRKNGIAYQRISELEEIFNIYRAVKSCEENFLFFKKCDIDFCNKILQVVKQFKACKIKPSWLTQVGDTLLDDKIHDLKIVYEKYEELIADKLDLSKFLDFFVENASKCENLSKINLFFVNFDSFSVEINSFICQLANYVNKIFIGFSKPLSKGNAFIYENDIFEKTRKLAQKYNVGIKVESPATSLVGNTKAIVENLFSFDIKPCENEDFFLNVLAKNDEDEIEFAAKCIKQAVYSGGRFKDFAVAVSDRTYFDKIKDIFSNYQIASYCDDAVNLSQTILGRTVLKCLEIAKVGFNKQNIQYLVQSAIFDISNSLEILQDVEYYEIDNKTEFLQKYPQFESLFCSIDMLCKCKTVAQFCDGLINLFSFFHYDKIMERLHDERHYKKESENEQAKELLVKVFEKLKNLGSEESIELQDFENLLKLSLQSVKVETIPSYIDAVYVGDITESYFEDVKYMFVLGATAGALPKMQNDTGIIDDDDIKKLRLTVNIEPEIRVLNRRNRLKLFEALCHAKHKLIVCCPMQTAEKHSQRAEFVNDLLKIFGNNVLHTSTVQVFDSPIFSKEENLKRLLFYVGCDDNLLEVYTKLKTERKSPDFLGAMRSVIKKQIPTQIKLNLLTHSICKNKISASELETYFACPYKRFLQYDLHIKPNETISPDKRKFGNFMHFMLKDFVEESKDALGKKTDKEINEFLRQHTHEIAKRVYDEKILKQPHFLRYLENEGKIILKNVVKEQKYSNFKPKFLEKAVSEQYFKDTKFVGFADRVDVFGDYFRILDYKTGETQNVLTDLYYGKKLQLFMYANCIKKALNLKLAGVYYFDCQTKYKKYNTQTKLLKGVTLKSDTIVEAMDNRLATQNIKSDILGMQRKNTDEEGFSYKWGSVENNFDTQLKYAEAVSNQALLEIKSGFVEAKPFAKSCDKCPYIAICMHKDSFRNTLKKEGEMDDE